MIKSNPIGYIENRDPLEGLAQFFRVIEIKGEGLQFAPKRIDPVYGVRNRNYFMPFIQ